MKLGFILGFALLAGVAGAVPFNPAPVNDRYTNSFTLVGLAGSVTSTNNFATLESPAETNFIASANITKSVWYKWTAPSNGVVSMDTFGSDFDTVLLVFTNAPGSTNPPAATNLIAGNDDYIYLFVPQSIVTFTAVSNRTYYIAVAGNAFPAPGYADSGTFVLNWVETVPRIPSGNFVFTSSLYAVSDLETVTGTALQIPGARVTVTRTNGFSGRVQVPYQVQAVTSVTRLVLATNVLFFQTNVVAGVTNIIPLIPPVTNIVQVFTNITVASTGQAAANTNGVLIFDDYQTSADFVVNVTPISNPTNGSDIQVTLGTPTLDAKEALDLLIPPIASGLGATSTVAVLNSFPGGAPTFNFSRSYARMPEGGTLLIPVQPTRTPGSNVTYSVDYQIVAPLGFELQAGSDYAKSGEDFTTSGTLSWQAGDTTPRYITINALNDGLVEFNEDIRIVLTNPRYTDNGTPSFGVNPGLGQVSQTTVTILYDEQPAGSVDTAWNKPGSAASVPPFLTYTGTQGGVGDGANGNGGTVYASAVQPDGKTLIAGSFTIYDSNPYNRIVRLLPNGYQDPTFLVAPNSGANDFISAMALQPDGKIVIVGNFTSFNGVNRYRIARLNSDGSVDNTFNPGLGANDKVWAVTLLSDGKIVIGGEFTKYNGVDCNRLVRLNADGSLDTSFAPSDLLNGPVYAVAASASTTINIDRPASGTEAEDILSINLGSSVSGMLTIDYDFYFAPDNMRVFYGGTNGVKIFDTGLTNGFARVVIPFGPTNGLTTNVITIVMNQGGVAIGTVWDYSASVSGGSFSQLYAGGAFNKAGTVTAGGIVRFNGNGIVDPTFAPGIGTYNPESGYTDPVNALVLQPDGKVLAGGSFSYVGLNRYNGLTRFNDDGTVDINFGTAGAVNGTYNPLSRVTDSVYVIKRQQDGTILIGGDFTTINQTRRVGLARLFSDGSLDTSFMDTAYNQFAGLINHYYNPNAINTNDYPQGNYRNAVYTVGVETNGGVIIGGNFLVVGGGSYEHSGTMPRAIPAGVTNGSSGIIKNGRLDVHPRSNVARVLGGATPGPGNIQFMYDTYSVGKNDVSRYLELTRTNGNLGVIGATFSTPLDLQGQPGIAGTNDFTAQNFQPFWDVAGPTRSDGLQGPNFNITSTATGPGVVLSITNNGLITGNLNADLELARPNYALFTLGGELIPLGAAMGARQQSMLTIIDPNFRAGAFGFSSPTFTVNRSASTATITVTRTGGTDGSVQVGYLAYPGTAQYGVDFNGTITGTLTFNQGETTKTFNVSIVPSSSTKPDKTVNLAITSISGGGTTGQTNAVLTIVNNVSTTGHIAFALGTNFVGESAGSVSVQLNRLGSSVGTLTVTAITRNGSALDTVNYTGTTNVLQWDNGVVDPKFVTIPILRDNVATSNLTFTVRLTNGLANSLPNTNVLGLSALTNTTVVITNVDFAGTVQFSAAAYSVKEYAGFALIPVIRTGGSVGAVTVNFAAINGTATSPANFTATNGTLAFANGEVAKYVRVPINNDGLATGLLALNLRLSNPTNTVLGARSNAVLNLIDVATVNEPPGSSDVTYNPLAGANGPIFALALQPANNQLIIGGDFKLACGVPRNNLARLNPSGSLDASFGLPSSAMGPNDTVRALAIQTDGRIIVGGFFTNFNSVARSYIARVNYDGSLDSVFNPGSGADNPIYAVAETFVTGQRKVMVAGSFTRLNGAVYNGVGRLNDNGTPDSTFNSGGQGANATVYALAVQADGKTIIGGDFTEVNGVPCNRLARLNVDGSLDSSFTAAAAIGANGSVRAIALQRDGAILIGGSFTSVGGFERNRIARLNQTDGSVDVTFDPGLGADDVVFAIAVQTDGRIVLGGEFNRCSGVTRNRITRLNPDGAVDPTINFGIGADAFVSAIVIEQGSIVGYPTNVPVENLIIGGGFTKYQGEPHARLARIYGGSVGGSGAYEFSAASYTVNENGIAALITVNRTGGTSGTNATGAGDILVPFATSNGTARAGTNYSTVITNLVFPMGEVQQTVQVPLIDDQVIQPTLTVNLALNPVPPAQYGNQPTAVLNIVNVNSLIRFATATYQVPKNIINGQAAITVVRTGSTTGTSTAQFDTTTNGTAQAIIDYLPRTNITVTFNPGVTSQVVNVPIVNNGLPQGNRTVSLALTNAIGSLLTAPTNALLTIIDTVTAPGELLFAATNYPAAEGNTNVFLTVLRTNGSAGSISFSYTTIPGTGLPGVNYVTTSNTTAMGDGVTSRVIAIPLLENNVVQGPVKFSVVIYAPSGGATLSSPTLADVTVSDNDTGLAFAVTTNYVSESAGVAAVSVVRLVNTTGNATVDFQTSDGTAIGGVQYSNTTGTLTFTNGEVSKNILVPLIYNPAVTGDRQFTVRLLNPGPPAQLVNPSTNTVIIQDADAGISFTNAATSVLKNAGNAVITVVNSNPAIAPVIVDTNTVPLTVQFFTVDGTAVAGVDYVAVSGTLILSNGIPTNTFSVPLITSTVLTGDRTFTVCLTNPTAPGQLIAPSNMVVTIVDNNSGVRFANNSYTVSKSGVAATINVLRTGYTNSTVSVDFQTANGTAVAGLNYTATNGTINFTNGEVSKNFKVTVIDNTIVQPNKTVLLQLLNFTNAISLAPSVATLTIFDSSGSLVLPAGAALIGETGAGLPNGIIDTNETVTLQFAFRVAGGTNVTSLNATLLATNGIFAPSGTMNYGPLVVRGNSVSRPFSFTARGTNTLPLVARFNLADGVKPLGQATFNFTQGVWTTTFVNTNAIVINDAAPASPYPSIINVSGVGSALLKATVLLTNITHASPSDIAALVMAPNGSNTLLMNNAGGQFALNRVTINFDDAATNFLPFSGQIVSGTNRPSRYLGTFSFP